MTKLKSIAVFCGSTFGKNPEYKRSAELLADEISKRDITLVYGGGNRGLMGVLAHRVEDNGGKVIGVLPSSLNVPSVTDNSPASEVIITKDMHERKSKMYSLSDGFIAMPGGIGTVEEIMEIYTWRQLKYTSKNIAFYNPGGYWNHILSFLDSAVEEGFLNEKVRNLLIVEDNPAILLERLETENREIPSKI